MAITLSPETEARLRERAAREGQEADTLANTLLAGVLADEVEGEEAKQKAFHAALLASGLVSRITPPRDPSKAHRPRIVVQGKPVSETVLEERR